MSGQIPTTNLDSLSIPTPAQWEGGWRAGSKAIQDMLGDMLFSADSGGGVLRGFDASGAALVSSVTRGTALIYDASPPSGVSKWGFVQTDATKQVTHAAHNSNPRIDLLTLSAVAEEGAAETTKIKGGGTQNRNTQHQTTVTLNIVLGTPGVSPSAPSVPAGHLLLHRVYVPASSGALEYLDRRNFAGVRERGSAGPKAHVLLGAGPTILDVRVEPSAHGDPAAWESGVLFDTMEDWPSWLRGRGATHEATGVFYPMATRSNRRWWRTVGWIGAVQQPDAGDIGMEVMPDTRRLSVGRIGANAAVAHAQLGFPVDGRDLGVTAAEVRYEVITAFTNVTLLTVRLVRVANDGSEVSIASQVLDNTVGFHSTSLAMVGFPVIDDDQGLFAVLDLTLSAGAGVGEIEFVNISVEFKEGQT